MNHIYGPAMNQPEVDFTELSELVNNLVKEREKMQAKESANSDTKELGAITYLENEIEDNPQISPNCGYPKTDNSKQFIDWLKGFIDGSGSFEIDGEKVSEKLTEFGL